MKEEKNILVTWDQYEETKENKPISSRDIRKLSFSYRTPQPVNDGIHPIFGPINNNHFDENINLFTRFLSTCNTNEKMLFIRKVYFLYFFQIILPLVTSILSYDYSIRYFFENNSWINLVSIGITVMIAIPLLLFPIISKTFFWNYILLYILSISVSIIVIFLSLLMGVPFTLFLASNVICVICLIVSTYLYSKDEFPSYELISSALSVILIFFIFISLKLEVKLPYLCISLVFSIVFVIFLICDTYIFFEVTSNKYSLDDYVLASMTLYTDALMIIFFLISRIFEKKETEKEN